MARKYKLTFPKGTPIDDDFLSFADTLFTELGLSPELAQKAATRWSEYTDRRVASMNAERQAGIDAFRTEMGSNYNAAVASGQRAARALGLDRKTLDVLQNDLGTRESLKLLVSIGQRLSGGAPAAAAGNSGDSQLKGIDTPEQARAEIDRLKNDSDFVASIFDKRAKGNAEVKERWNQLHARAYPTPEPGAAPASPAPAAGDDKAAAARTRINELIGNESFMAGLRDPKHADHRENRETFDNLHAEAGITR